MSLETLEVAARYHLSRALALLAAAWAAERFDGRAVRCAGWLFLVGIVLFSGSLYALPLSGQRLLVAITLPGGLRFLGGWASLAWDAWRGEGGR